MNRPFNRERGNAKPLNWHRGLFRLWVLISSAWIMGWVIYFIIDFIASGLTIREILVIPVVLFGPPVALLLLGLGTRWAFHGFEGD
jgi:hypothetical protein